MVAQSRNNACVWYNIDTPDRLSIFPVKGEIMDIARADGKTEVGGAAYAISHEECNILIENGNISFNRY